MKPHALYIKAKQTRGRACSKSLAALVFFILCLPALQAEDLKDAYANEVSGLPHDRFGILIGGKLRGYFTQCSGLGSQNEVREFRGVDGRILEKTPGPLSVHDTVCRRRVASDTYFWDWRLVVESSMSNYRRLVYIVLWDERNVEIARWELTDAWPSSVFVTATKETGGFAEEAVVLTNMVTRRVR
jgi:phage tail-like protein